MFSTGLFRRAAIAGLIVACAVPATAQPAGDASLYRVFLRDGSTVLSFGEFARVADRVVVSLPVGTALHMLSLPADSVDWERTDAYAESVRATRYAATRGPDDLALLSDAVSRALADISITSDPNRKIAMALEARQNVMRWAAEHFGYQAERVAQLASLFDDVITEVRTQAGMKNVELSMVATMAAPPSTPLLPAPTFRESIEQALSAATLAPEATERTSLLHAIQQVLREAGPEHAAWTTSLNARVSASIATEERATRGYETLTKTTLQGADQYARSADVTGVERVIRRALAEDDRLGQRRPQEMASLLAMLDTKLDAARRLRLARDNWAVRAQAIRAFRTSMAEPMSLMRLSKTSLDEIRRLAGPTPARLRRLLDRVNATTRLLAVMTIPAEGTNSHALLKTAVQFATRAAEGRERAVMSGEMPQAWEAASAASGALLFLERAVEELAQLAKLPELQAPR
jgi:hypothetical protein